MLAGVALLLAGTLLAVLPVRAASGRRNGAGPSARPRSAAAERSADMTTTARTGRASVPSQHSPVGGAPLVVRFEDGSRDQADLLGGKGANLCEMTGLGLPVPGGFI